MAVGFPAKTNFATGDVLTATNMNDVTGTLNLLESAQYAAAKNSIINSNFNIWQRGTSINITTDAAFYTADRFMAYSQLVPITVSRQATSDTTNLPFIQYCARIQRTAANTGTSDIRLIYSQETSNSISYAGKTVTLSFYARAGANYSGASNVLKNTLATGTGTDQNYITTGFTGVINNTQNNTLTTTWQRFTQTVTFPTNATEYAVLFRHTPSGTAGANDYFEVTGVQLEAASTASSFQTASGSIGGELALCQRYYYRQTAGTAFAPMGTGTAYSTTSVAATTTFPVTMRVTPTSLDYSTVAVYDGVSTIVPSALTISTTSISPYVGLLTAAVTGATQFRPYNLIAYNSATAYVGYSAEL
jgi:hypothetical protein